MSEIKKRDGGVLVLLAVLTLFFCWFYVGRYGVFGAKVDWISQHSVLPDYFRQQFYETGNFFPEFAPNIGGGQNIYHFSYYGLFSPIILLSYALPFVKMGDYLMAVSVLGLAVSVQLLYIWLRKRGFSVQICFPVSVLFLLAGPMIFHSYCQIMFVNYMPFLCMAFLGVDHYFEQEKEGLYTVSVFLMIMTSFYFSICGMLVLVLYGLHRYYQGGSKRNTGKFLRDGLRFLRPMIHAVLMSGVLLVPTAASLLSRQGRSAVSPGWKELFIPDIAPLKFLYNAYGVGLTALTLVVLITGLTYREKSERVLAWGSMAVLCIPVFSYLLNGGLYLRDKVFIPFLPLLCYMTAYYLRKQRNGEVSFWTGFGSCLITIGILIFGKNTVSYQIEWFGLLLDGVIVAVCFLIFQRKKCVYILIIPALVSLMFYGIVFHSLKGKALERTFYEKVTDTKNADLAAGVLQDEEGFYRMETYGDEQENGANLNRILDIGQYSTSIYSSSYHDGYHKFRTETFQVEEPFRNFLMQSASANPVFRKVMGVKYVLSERKVPGYEVCKNVKAGQTSRMKVYKNDNVAPILYATDQVISEKEYEKLHYPYNQTALAQYAVVQNPKEKSAGAKDVRKQELTETAILFSKDSKLKRTENGYRIDTAGECKVKVKLETSAFAEETNGTRTLFLQFQVKNNHPKKDVAVWLQGVRNKLTAKSHIYYNGNTTFTWALALEKGQTELEMKFGEGSYEIRGMKAFIRTEKNGQDTSLYQAEFMPDKEKTKGNRICGTLGTDSEKYVITSIPYEENFEVRIDGKKVPYEMVNTAFLGFQIEAGRHEVEILYHAPWAAAGKFLSGLGLLFFAVVMIKEIRCKKLHCRN